MIFLAHCPTPVECTHLLTYQLVGDNIDKNVRPRDMRSDHQTRSLHYFHTYAVRDRVDISHFSKTSIPNVGKFSSIIFFPQIMISNLSLETLRYLWDTHYVNIFLFFKEFGNVERHIQHEFSKECQKCPKW